MVGSTYVAPLQTKKYWGADDVNASVTVNNNYAYMESPYHAYQLQYYPSNDVHFENNG